MNWERLFKAQAELDKHILQEKGLEGQYLLDMKILSLQVELGELANEQRTWKFWSEDREPRVNNYVWCKCYPSVYDCKICEGVGRVKKNLLLEEFVDCLHFILSIGNEKKFHRTDYNRVRESDLALGLTYKDENVTKQFVNVFNFISEFEDMRSFDEFADVLLSFIGLGEMLGFTEQQIEQAYWDKNSINHERQESNY